MKVSEQPLRGSPPRSGRPRATGGGDGHRGSRFSQPRFRTDFGDTASFSNPPRRARARRTVPGSGRHTEKVRRSDSASAPGPGPAAPLRRGSRGRIAGGIQRSHDARGSPRAESGWGHAALRHCEACRARHGSALARDPRRTLEGKQSPWKDRMSHRWQRRSDITDSSAEQSLGVGCFAFFRQVRPPISYFGRRRRSAMARQLRPPGGSPLHALGQGKAGWSQRLVRASPPSLGA
jgi:hypothetical protein